MNPIVVLLLCGFGLTVVPLCGAPPVVDKNKVKEPAGEEDPMDESWQSLEYHRYLQDVVSVLESDPVVRKRLENLTVDDIKSGRAAEHLEFAGEHIRSKLHEVKRREIERLRHAIQKLADAGKHSEIKIPEHVDHGNMDTFEKEDLKKLIVKTHRDLDEIDKLRKTDFKQHELKKEVEYREELKEKKTKEEWEDTVKKHEEVEKKKKTHEKVHHAGSKPQLEEVWEEADKQDKESFDMRTFFNIHDTDSNGYLDLFEIEALFQRELDKVYDPKEEGFDPAERDEEEARMREHVLKEMDQDQDGLISFEEFMGEENDPNFDKDESWDTLEDGEDVFSEDELKNYEAEYDRIHGKPVTYLPPPDIAHPPSFAPPGFPGGAAAPTPAGQANQNQGANDHHQLNEADLQNVDHNKPPVNSRPAPPQPAAVNDHQKQQQLNNLDSNNIGM